MKFGIRKPSIRKSIKARTTGKIKRNMKKAINPFYGKKGMGLINNPKKAIYNKVYNKTTVGLGSIINTNKKEKTKVNNIQSIKKEHIKNKNEVEGTIMKKGTIIRNIFGGLFIFTGLVGMFSSGLMAGIFMILLGISLLPIFYEKTKLNIKYIQIILPIILIFLFGMVAPKSTTETNTNINETNNTNIVQEEKNIEISELKFNESEMEIDIKENKEIILEILPNNANSEDLELCTSDSQIAILEKSDVEDTENKITLKIKPMAEGNCEIYVKSKNGIESNKIVLKIVDNERIEKEKKDAEEQAKKEAEEQAKKQAEEQAKKQAEEQAKKQTQSTTNASSQTKSSQQGTTSSSTQSNSNNTHGKSVYRTPSGKRYHFDPDCGGKNSYQTTLDAAKSSGLTPCKKCAQ